MAACAHCGWDERTPARSWFLWLPYEPASQNEIANVRGHSAKAVRYRDMREVYRVLLRNDKIVQGIPDATTRRRVVFTRVYDKRGKPRDRINSAGGMKPLLDAMVLVKLLRDDSEEWVDDFYRQRREVRVSYQPGVEILIEEMA